MPVGRPAPGGDIKIEYRNGMSRASDPRPRAEKRRPRRDPNSWRRRPDDATPDGKANADPHLCIFDTTPLAFSDNALAHT